MAEKPVYIKTNEKWVKQTAFQMQNNEWVKISSAIPVKTYAYVDRTITEAKSDIVTTIPREAFAYCDSLVSAVFPNVTSIDTNAFWACRSLKKVVIGTNKTTRATLGTSVFLASWYFTGQQNEYNPDGLKDGYIYVPLSLVADYRGATNWETYATQIMPYVATVEELANIDGSTYDKACVGTDYVEYAYNGTSWEVYR